MKKPKLEDRVLATLVTERDLAGFEDSLLRATPGIFQAHIPKAFELRVTFIGRRSFTAKLLSQETIGGRLDWRKSYSELKMEPFQLPKSVEERCWKLMQELGIVFGCFDFIVTPQNEFLFLEVNEMGQFLFVEYATDLPVLDAFCALLMAGSVNYFLDPGPARVRYKDLLPEVEGVTAGYAKRHVAVPDAIVNEDLQRGSDPAV
jgi:hypothetical protein